MKKIILSLSLIFFSMNALALNANEEAEFKNQVLEMNNTQYVASLALTATALTLYCPAGTAATGISAVIDTLPLTSLAQAILQNADVPYGVRPNNNYQWAGGWLAILADTLSLGHDITDLDLDEPFVDEMRAAYAETAEWYDAAFDESGYCVDQWDQLGILLGVK